MYKAWCHWAEPSWTFIMQLFLLFFVHFPGKIKLGSNHEPRSAYPQMQHVQQNVLRIVLIRNAAGSSKSYITALTRARYSGENKGVSVFLLRERDQGRAGLLFTWDESCELNIVCFPKNLPAQCRRQVQARKLQHQQPNLTLMNSIFFGMFLFKIQCSRTPLLLVTHSVCYISIRVFC